MRETFFVLKKTAVPGIDGMTWVEYEERLEERLPDLLDRVHSGAFRALPSKRSYIPKSDGQLRPLGIAALEDKLVQSALVVVLNAIYEEDFAGFSYGFRRGRGQHPCLDALGTVFMCKRVSWVLDADIRRFFDTIDHGWMMKFLEHRIADRRVLRLIQKWLEAGVIEDGVWSETEEGTPQGSGISPLLANIYLHYVLDLWVKHWRKKTAQGNVYIVRYADDFIVCFERKDDGERFLADLKGRLASFSLALHPDKTRLIEFGRFAACNRHRKGDGQPETFDFLGFTHYCGRSPRGEPCIMRKTIAKRMRAKIQEIAEALMERRHESTPDLGAWLRAVLNGYFNYHAVPGNRTSMGSFYREICRAWRSALRRRSQKARWTWDQFKELIQRWLPKPQTRHPLPWIRFGVTHPM
jgi:group II intron reverse transcriptase/maturase